MNNQKRIYFNAYACDPEKGSEPGIGWNWVSYVAKRYPTHLVTADRGRNQILLDAIARDPDLSKNLSVTFLPWSLPKDPLSKVLLRYFQPYYTFFYRRWLKKSYQLAKKMVAEESISLVHQNTYMGFRDPGDFWKLEIPTVWGPVTGTNLMRSTFLSSLGYLECLRHSFRNLLNSYYMNWDLNVKFAIKGYSKVIAGSEDNLVVFSKFSDSVEVIPCNLLKIPPRSVPTYNHSSQKIHFCFSCLHLSRKGGSFLIRAFARAVDLNCCNLHLEIIGNGIMTAEWKKLAETLKCSDNITWHGFVSRDKVLEIMNTSDVFVLPSLADVYPTVIAEAFSCGLPVITTDVPGVGNMVNDESGWVLGASSPKILIQNLFETFVEISQNPEALAEKRNGVKIRAREFLFEDRMKRLEEIYEELLAAEPRKKDKG